MKYRIIFQILILFSLSEGGFLKAQDKPDDFPVLKGPYLGRKLPGDTPEIFAPGIISTRNIEFKIAISPDGDEIYFTRQQGRLRTILFTERTVDGWSCPRPVSFSGKYMDEYPTLSPDGRKLFFQSTRPIPAGLNTSDFRRGFRFWVSTRSGEDWGEPEILDARVNIGICITTVSSEGSIYFFRSSPPKIMMSKWSKGEYSEPVQLSPIINDDKYGATAPCLSPDNDYIIFASGRPSFGKSDLWISFKTFEGSWNEPKNLGSSINTEFSESAPVLSPEGKYLFYTSQGNIYWVDAKIIEELRPKE